MKTEIQGRADFSQVRYANCWEDADILITALEPEGRRCLSIGSAGDNSLSLLAAGASSVTIAEMNPAQVACIGLRIAAHQRLSYPEFLILLGEVDEPEAGLRMELYRRCRGLLEDPCRDYWDQFPDTLGEGFGRKGKFESYFTVFREKFLPLVHSREKIARLLESRSPAAREDFYEGEWNTWRWRLLFRFFFSRFVMGRLGRDPEFFKYVEGSVSDRILSRTRHALVTLDPGENPYLRWILTGRYGETLPHALREDSFDRIRERIDGVTVVSEPIESLLVDEGSFDAFNLSDIFEYMSLSNTERLLGKICHCGTGGARLAYWNMLAPRSRPESLSDRLLARSGLARTLFEDDKAFFYSNFIVEEVTEHR